MKPTGPTNIVTKKLVDDIMQKGHAEKINFLLKLGRELNASKRNKDAVNLKKINRLCKDGETIIIPRKLLASGELEKKLTISALSWSEPVEKKIKKSGSKLITIEELVNKNPEGKNVRLIK